MLPSFLVGVELRQAIDEALEEGIDKLLSFIVNILQKGMQLFFLILIFL